MRTLSSLDVMGKNTAEKWFQSNTRVFHKVDEEEEDVPQPEKAQESRGRGREEDKEVGRNDLKRRRCGGAKASEKSEAKWTTSDAVKKRPDHNGNVEEKKRRRVELVREKEHFAMNETEKRYYGHYREEPTSPRSFLQNVFRKYAKSLGLHLEMP